MCVCMLYDDLWFMMIYGSLKQLDLRNNLSSENCERQILYGCFTGVPETSEKTNPLSVAQRSTGSWSINHWKWGGATRLAIGVFNIWFPKIGYPQSSSILMGISIINQPSWIPPFMETPICQLHQTLQLWGPAWRSSDLLSSACSWWHDVLCQINQQPSQLVPYWSTNISLRHTKHTNASALHCHVMPSCIAQETIQHPIWNTVWSLQSSPSWHPWKSRRAWHEF